MKCQLVMLKVTSTIRPRQPAYIVKLLVKYRQILAKSHRFDIHIWILELRVILINYES